MKYEFLILVGLSLAALTASGQELKSKKTRSLGYYEEYNVLASDKKIKQGDYKKYKADGSQSLSGKFDKNSKVGEWTYSENGELEQTYNYDEKRMTFQKKPANPFSIKTGNQTQLLTVDTPPTYLGSKICLTEEINKVLRYPEHAKRMGVEGPVTVSILIKEDNSLGELRIIKGIKEDCNQDLLKAIQKIPANWFAATIADKKVNGILVLTFEYKLDNISENAAITVR